MGNRYVWALTLAVLFSLTQAAYCADTETAPAGEATPAAAQSKSQVTQATPTTDKSQPQPTTPSPDAKANAETPPGAGTQTTPATGEGDTETVRAAVKDLLDGLVEEGVLKQDQADAVMRKTEQRLGAGDQAKRPPPPADPNVVGVTYVPQFVIDEIRDQVRNDLRKDVLKDVLTQAKEERWGMPGVVPKWVRRLHWYGDLRLREQSDMFASDNAPNTYPDFLKINQAGGLSKLKNPYINTTQNRDRLRVRARLGMDATVTDGLKAAIRITTGNTTDPVSTNQTLGNYGGRYQVVWDQVYLRYQKSTTSGEPWLTLWGGRLPNPWLHTDLVWDSDLNFEGLAGSLRYNLADMFGPATGENHTIFFTAGAFPLQEVELSSRDKWLYGAQFGSDWQMHSGSTIRAGVAYYDYVNITGKMNSLDSNLLDFTAPQSMQKGNTVIYDIRNDQDPTTNLYALATEYKLVNITASLDLAQLAPIHVIITGDYVKNIGYSRQQVFEHTGLNLGKRNQGFQLQIAVGHPHINRHGDWKVTGAFKHLERDAVLDAFTDSDFHLGGTDAEGWILQGDYGLMENTWLTVRWLSSDAIDGPPLGINTLQVDFNTRF